MGNDCCASMERKRMAKKLVNGDIPSKCRMAIRFENYYGSIVTRTIEPLTFAELQKEGAKISGKPLHSVFFMYINKSFKDSGMKCKLFSEDDMPAFKLWVELNNICLPILKIYPLEKNGKTIKK
jgi:hypothetical protein